MSEKVLDTVFTYVINGKDIAIKIKDSKKEALRALIKNYILRYRCPICGKQFRNLRGVKQHIRKDMRCREALREWIREILASS